MLLIMMAPVPFIIETTNKQHTVIVIQFCWYIWSVTFEFVFNIKLYYMDIPIILHCRNCYQNLAAAC